MTNYITVTNGGGPINAICYPTSTNTDYGFGIYNFSFGTIDFSSLSSSEGNLDNTCGQSTTLVAGATIQMNVETSSDYTENVKSWIDYNNNGDFEANELIFSSSDDQFHQGYVQIDINAPLNTPLRLRVISDYDDFDSACDNLTYGQSEDYTVIFIQNSLPPLADFVANYTTVNIGTTVQFTDISENVPTSWEWSFTGADNTTSTIQNPTNTYSNLGDYEVTLKVMNEFGEDSITKTSYIHVVNSINMCGINQTNASDT